MNGTTQPRCGEPVGPGPAAAAEKEGTQRHGGYTSHTSEPATQHLRDQITGGHWPVGTELPAETALAKTLGVGRSTVQEALRALAGAGLVHARQGSGVFVVATEPAEDWATRLRQAAITDVYEVRLLIEVEAAQLAAQRRTEDDLADMGAAHNPVLTGLFTEFVPVPRQALVDLVELLDLRSDDPNHGDAGHAALVDAVAAADAGAAATAVRDELNRTLTQLRGI